ncbi:copper resistance D family protein [Actinacidiphila bryophytorum]|uniref:copper resistance D family protein n=1 Tax=Actinacidiphila bryophytorum TaxID=1436133 RepID=UPI002176B456|nr:CopD family protein [Actinacidiphila bryophytorum]UWE12199.1 CopD family protein [Actinacidiphila bryophytorum]
MPLPELPPHVLTLSAAAPSTPLGPFEDSAVTWTTWVTLMGFTGLAALALIAVGPAARTLGKDALAATTARLARAAAALGVLAVPAVLSDLAHGASESGGYDYGTAWNSLYDGSNGGRLLGLEVTLVLLGAALLAPLTVRSVAAGPARTWLLAAGLAAGSVALGTTKFPDAVPDDWGRTSFETLMWMLHLLGGAVWLGGLAGLFLLALPGALPADGRGAFWSRAIRRFSAAAMTCVAAIALSGLFLYWEHVDGLSQLTSTMYGRVLGVKILIFGTLLLLGAFNQFWLHPRIDALRAAGDERPLHTVLVRRFPVVVAAETLLGMSVLFVAPFLHGSARNQAFQADAARHAVSADDLPKLPAKEVSASTWVWGTSETLLVVALMIAGYLVSGRIARRRTARATVDGPAVEPALSPS